MFWDLASFLFLSVVFFCCALPRSHSEANAGASFSEGGCGASLPVTGLYQTRRSSSSSYFHDNKVSKEVQHIPAQISESSLKDGESRGVCLWAVRATNQKMGKEVHPCFLFTFGPCHLSRGCWHLYQPIGAGLPCYRGQCGSGLKGDSQVGGSVAASRSERKEQWGPRWRLGHFCTNKSKSNKLYSNMFSVL